MRVARRNRRISGASSIRTTTRPGFEAGPGSGGDSAIGEPVPPGGTLERQREADRGTASRPIPRGDGATVDLDDGPADRQTEPDPAHPRGVSPVELLERPLLVAGREARAAVAHLHADLGAHHSGGD